MSPLDFLPQVQGGLDGQPVRQVLPLSGMCQRRLRGAVGVQLPSRLGRDAVRRE